ncbi:MAG TPA: HNH endonuclease family protein [Mycobacteriales bacterium]|nr:HNH endonuclease family protein [Mycobacteriales bacterium]
MRFRAAALIAGASLAAGLAAGCDGQVSLGSGSSSLGASAGPTATANPTPTAGPSGPATQSAAPGSARAELAALPIKGRAPMTGYHRDQFGPAWSDTDHNGCDTRNDVLRSELTHLTFRAGTHECIVLSGDRADPYTGTTIHFVRGGASELDIDHVVALGDAWQTGAQQWPADKRLALANDPLNLLAVDSSANRRKGDADAASWLPPNKAFRCDYVARQVAVKTKYELWVTAAEKSAIGTVLATCPAEPAPSGGNPTVAPHR